jgi:selenide,water dikinase
VDSRVGAHYVRGMSSDPTASRVRDQRFRLTNFARAAGCAGKLGPADLSSILRTLPQVVHPDLLVGTSTSDDAGVFRLTPDLALVQTVDFFAPIVDDPFAFGQIAAANALSDVYAMGGIPCTALNIAAFPNRDVPMEIFGEILRGGIEKAHEAGVVVVGGHTLVDEEIKFGMAVTGTIHPNRIWRNVGARPGDVLLLTKPLGTAVVTTAVKRGDDIPDALAAAVRSMTTLNAAAAGAMRAFQVHACTDVTGFGLLGHAYEMAHGSGVRLELDASTLPLLPQARELAANGTSTGGCRRNRDWLADKVKIAPDVPADLVELAFDPQTSGGLLLAIASEDAPRAIEALRAAKTPVAVAIGHAASKAAGAWVELR